MDREKHIKLMSEMFHKSEEECNEMFNSGMFNEITRGVVALAMENCGYERAAVLKVLNECSRVLDERTAGEYREFYKRFQKLGREPGYPLTD